MNGEEGSKGSRKRREGRGWEKEEGRGRKRRGWRGGRGGRGRKGEGGREREEGQGQEWVARRREGCVPYLLPSLLVLLIAFNLDNTLKAVLSPGWEGKEVGTQHSGRNV